MSQVNLLYRLINHGENLMVQQNRDEFHFKLPKIIVFHAYQFIREVRDDYFMHLR